MRDLAVILTVLGILLACNTDARAVTIDWVTIDDAGNLADTRYETPGYGGVEYIYHIGKYEVTNSQYCEFLNAVAATDTYNLYNTNMSSTVYGGIERSGFVDSYTYTIKAGRQNNPVNFVSWYDALRFANWLHNGQPAGVEQNDASTEDGAYDMDQDPNTHKPDALAWLPTEDEWYKAAYYDPDLNAGAGGYWDYATQSNTTPTSEAPPGTDMVNGSANYYYYGYAVGGHHLADAGVYTARPSESAYGTFDQNGNVWEWNEAFIESIYRGARGASWDNFAYQLPASYRAYSDPTYEGDTVGFRLVGKPCQHILLGDMNMDCKVNLLDFGLMAANWLIDCYLTPTHPACIPIETIDNDGDGWDLSVDCDDNDPTLNLDDADSDSWNTCDGDCDDSNPEINPGTSEVCDGLDNDCDGAVDDGNPGGGGSCDTGLPGVCADGALTCQGGVLQCVQNTPASPEVCDGLDNDCDGAVDDGNPGGGGSCNTGLLGVCADGTLTCQGGVVQCVQNTPASPEVCDGLDNDCDGVVDEGCGASAPASDANSTFAKATP